MKTPTPTETAVHSPLPWTLGSDWPELLVSDRNDRDEFSGPKYADIGMYAKDKAVALEAENAQLRAELESMCRWHERRIASLEAGEPMDISLRGLPAMKIEIAHARAALAAANRGT